MVMIYHKIPIRKKKSPTKQIQAGQITMVPKTTKNRAFFWEETP